MSGRTRVTLPDGRRVTGYRKTLVQRPRRAPGELGDFRLSFFLPTMLALVTPPPGPIEGIIGAEVLDHGRIQITGSDREWVFGQAAAVIARLCRGHDGLMISAALSRGEKDEPITKGHTFVILTTPAIVLATSYDKPFVFPGPKR